MKNKDFREIQVSSSLLVVIFLGVLALGVFIFLLGVSVGKKQVGAGAPTQIVTQQIPEPVKEPPVKPTPSETASDAANLLPGAGASQSAAGDPAAKPPAKEPIVDKAPAKKTVELKRTAPAARGLYYVQVLAVADRAQAQAAADGYRKQGYTAVIADPPAGEKNYKVRLGGYATKDRATELLKKLNAAAGKRTDYWVVQY